MTGLIDTCIMHIFPIRLLQKSYWFLFQSYFRFIRVFWYGLKTRWSKKVNSDDYLKYLTEWRDITMLRLIEGFLEAAPQMILQLYVLATRNEFIVSRDWLTALSAVCSVISLAWAIVSYSHALRLCLSNKGLSWCGYIFQILYRLLMVSSRVISMVLFASALQAWVFVFVIVHCTLMAFWLSFHQTNVCLDEKGFPQRCLEKFFHLIIAIIYLFCFINVEEGATRDRISLYYLVFFLENGFLMGFWYPYRTIQGWLVFATFGVVFGGFVLGIVCMLFYYKYFHPGQDITEGWICCKCCRQQASLEDEASVSDVAASTAIETISYCPTEDSESHRLNKAIKGEPSLENSHLLRLHTPTFRESGLFQNSSGTPIDVEFLCRPRSASSGPSTPVSLHKGSPKHVYKLKSQQTPDQPPSSSSEALISAIKPNTETYGACDEFIGNGFVNIEQPENEVSQNSNRKLTKSPDSDSSLPVVNVTVVPESSSRTSSELSIPISIQNVGSQSEPHYRSPPTVARVLHQKQDITKNIQSYNVIDIADENKLKQDFTSKHGNILLEGDTRHICLNQKNCKTMDTIETPMSEFRYEDNDLPRNPKLERQFSISEDNLVQLTKIRNRSKYDRLISKDDACVQSNNKMTMEHSSQELPEREFLRQNMKSLVTSQLKTKVAPTVDYDNNSERSVYIYHGKNFSVSLV